MKVCMYKNSNRLTNTQQAQMNPLHVVLSPQWYNRKQKLKEDEQNVEKDSKYNENQAC